MEAVILVIHLMVALAIIGLVLVQRSEGGGLGMGGSGGAMGSMMTARRTADFLTRTTAILATIFFATSLLLAILADNRAPAKSILDAAPTAQEKPEKPAEPTAPISK
jgi:preprotein translocase subunit SecG